MAPKPTNKISQQTHTSTVGAVTTSTADPTVVFAKPTLNLQERLQDLAIARWNQPIDEALELHLHGRSTFTNIGTRTILSQDSWAKWSPKFCKAMLGLISRVSAEQANQLLSAKVAVAYASQDATPDGRYGLQPFTLHTDAGTGSSTNTSIFNNSASSPPFLVHVYAIADKYDVPPLRALAEQRLRKIYKPELAVASIEDLVATIREVDTCTPDKLESGNGLWGVVMPAMRANMGWLLRHEEFRELLLDMPELNFHLLGVVNSATPAASANVNATIVNLEESEEESEEGDEDGYDDYGSRRAGGRLAAARYGQGRRLG